jgi:hypothetical protein
LILRRKSNFFLTFLLAGMCIVCLIPVHAFFAGEKARPFIEERMALVKKHGLTDLCLFTDARYTRNPAVADFATAFQDHPSSLEHFPSGSIISPPDRVRYGLDR